MHIICTEKHPFGECSNCKTGYSSELAGEYAGSFKYCPYCGEAFEHHVSEGA